MVKFIDMEEKQVIFGKVPSKSNCYKIITLNGHGSLAKGKELKDYEKSFYLQCNLYRNKNIEGLFEFYADIFYPSQRQDIDNSSKVLLDSLQACNAIKNDRNCVKLVLTKYIDRDNPRVEFIIKEV